MSEQLKREVPNYKSPWRFEDGTYIWNDNYYENETELRKDEDWRRWYAYDMAKAQKQTIGTIQGIDIQKEFPLLMKYNEEQKRLEIQEKYRIANSRGSFPTPTQREWGLPVFLACCFLLIFKGGIGVDIVILIYYFFLLPLMDE